MKVYVVGASGKTGLARVARLIFSSGWHISLDGQDVYSRADTRGTRGRGGGGRMSPMA